MSSRTCTTFGFRDRGDPSVSPCSTALRTLGSESPAIERNRSQTCSLLRLTWHGQRWTTARNRTRGSQSRVCSNRPLISSARVSICLPHSKAYGFRWPGTTAAMRGVPHAHDAAALRLARRGARAGGRARSGGRPAADVAVAGAGRRGRDRRSADGYASGLSHRRLTGFRGACHPDPRAKRRERIRYRRRRRETLDSFVASPQNDKHAQTPEDVRDSPPVTGYFALGRTNADVDRLITLHRRQSGLARPRHVASLRRLPE